MNQRRHHTGHAEHADHAEVTTPSAVIELRRYTLHPGQREVLIDLFEREFITPQEAVGMSILGLFRDHDHPDTFTWLRGFADMTARLRALESFYGGTVWKEHRNAANATMIDSDDVLLLTSVAATSVQQAEPTRSPREFVVVTVHLDEPMDDEVVAELGRRFADIDGYRLELFLRTLHTPNTFPALPVRDEAHVVVAVLATTSSRPVDWQHVGTSLSAVTNIEVMRLEPTSRSRLR